MNKAEKTIKRMKEKGYNRVVAVMELFDKKFRKANHLPPEYIKALDKYYS
jgi:hypothetical protein